MTSALHMTEADLLVSVLDLASLLGLRTAHFRPARTAAGWRTAVAGDGKGFPDLVVSGRSVLFRELKADRGRLSPEQVLWVAALKVARADVAVWTPADLRSGRVESELRAIRPATHPRRETK